MTTYFDHYFDAADVNAFLPLLAAEPNIIGPLVGTLESGTDPARAYLAVRNTGPLTVPAGAQATPPEVAIQLLGVWA